MLEQIKQRPVLISTSLTLAIAFFLLFTMVSISLSQIFLFLAFVLWLFILIRDKQMPRFPSFFWPLLAYGLLSLLSSFFSVNPEISLKDSRELLLFLVIPIVYCGFTKEKTLRQTQLAFLASACLSILYSYFLFFFRSSPGERVAGFMGHYMTQAGLLLLFCTMALSLFLFSRNKSRYLWGLGFFLALGVLILTLTRSAWLGLVIAVCLLLFLYKPKLLIIVPVALGFFLILSPQHIRQRALSTFSAKTPSNQWRMEYINAGIKIIKDYPLFGTGPDTVDMVFQNPKYGLSELAKQNVHLHSNIIQIASERGIPTLIAWIIFLIWAFISLLKRLDRNQVSTYPFVAAALAALCGFFTAGLFEYNFADSEIVTLFLYLITLPFAFNRILKTKTIKEDDLE
jgi:O-antigen ligase